MVFYSLSELLKQPEKENDKTSPSLISLLKLPDKSKGENQ
jgi:hypothetical protein